MSEYTLEEIVAFVIAIIFILGGCIYALILICIPIALFNRFLECCSRTRRTIDRPLIVIT